MLSAIWLRLPLRSFHLAQTRALALTCSHPSYYDDLGVHPQASSKEIKDAFYRLSKEHHPDRNVDNPSALKKFQDISEAYDTLSNPRQRSKYDKGVLGRSSSVAEREAASHRFEGETFYGSRSKGLKTAAEDAPSKNLDSWVNDQRKQSFESKQFYSKLRKSKGSGAPRGRTLLDKRGPVQTNDKTDRGIGLILAMVLVLVIVIRSIL